MSTFLLVLAWGASLYIAYLCGVISGPMFDHHREDDFFDDPTDL